MGGLTDDLLEDPDLFGPAPGGEIIPEETPVPTLGSDPSTGVGSGITQDLLDDPQITGASNITQELLSDPEIMVDPLPEVEQTDDFNFFGVLGEEALRTAATNTFGDLIFGDKLEEAIGDIGRERPGITSGVASGFGQATGDIATIGAFAGVGSLAGPGGAAAGAAIGTGVVFGQGLRRELTDVWSETRVRGGTRGQAAVATLTAVPGTVAGEMLDLVKFGRIVPKRFRRNFLGAVAHEAADAVGTAVERVGGIKRYLLGGLTGAASEAAGEAIQTASQIAAVETGLEGGVTQFPGRFARAIPTRQVGEAAIIGGIVGGGTRTVVDIGLDVIDRSRQPESLDQVDQNALEIAQAITEVLDPDTDTNAVNIGTDVATPSQIKQIVDFEDGVEVQVADDGSTNIIKEGTAVEPQEASGVLGELKDILQQRIAQEEDVIEGEGPFVSRRNEQLKKDKEITPEQRKRVIEILSEARGLTDVEKEALAQGQIPFEEDVSLSPQEKISKAIEFLESAALTEQEKNRFERFKTVQDETLAANNLETLRETVLKRIEKETEQESLTVSDVEDTGTTEAPAPTPQKFKREFAGYYESENFIIDRVSNGWNLKQKESVGGDSFVDTYTTLKQAKEAAESMVQDGLTDKFGNTVTSTSDESLKQETEQETEQEIQVPPAKSMQDIVQEEMQQDDAVRREQEIREKQQQQYRTPPPGVDPVKFNAPETFTPKEQAERDTMDQISRRDSKLDDKGKDIGAAPKSLFKPQSLPQRYVDDPTLDPQVKIPFEANKFTGETGMQYIVAKNIETQQQARDHIDKNGFDESLQRWRINDDRLSNRMHSAIGIELMRKLKDRIIEADEAGATNVAEKFRTDQEELMGRLADFATDAGQAVQYLRMLQQAATPRDVVQLHVKLLRNLVKNTGGVWEDLSQDTLDRAEKIAEKFLKAPEDSRFAKQFQRDMLMEIHGERVDKANILEAYWYANILSGLNTQAVNLWGSGTNLLARIVGTAFVDPRGAWDMLRAIGPAQKRALLEGRAALAGEDISRTLDKFSTPGVWEILLRKHKIKDPKDISDHLKNLKLKPVEALATVFRALGAGDAYWFRTAYDAQANFVASRLLREELQQSGEKLSSEEFANRLSESLNNSTEAYQQALLQADAEINLLYTPEEQQSINRDRLATRRAFEIIEQSRPELIQKEATRFGQITTFTQPPEGTIGIIVNQINAAVNGIRVRIPGTNLRGRPLKFFIPFTNIVGNVLSSSLDFTPVGAYRAYTGTTIAEGGPKFSDFERRQKFGASLFGTAAAASILAVAENFLDPEDPFPDFAIYGQGPPFNSKERELFDALGGRPFSFKIGDTFIDFKETPLVSVFAPLGAYHDALRFSKSFNEQAALSKLNYSLSLAIGAIGSQSFLKSVSDLADLLTGSKRGATVGKVGRNIGTGFIPFKGFLGDIAKLSDPTKVDKRENMWAAVVGDLPVAQRIGTRPQLNVFGEPIELSLWEMMPFISRVSSRKSADPVFKWLADNNLGIPTIPNKVSLGVSGRTRRRKIEKLKDYRERTIGRFAFDLLTEDEHYEYVSRQGPLIKEAIRDVIRKQRNRPKERLQEEIDKDVRKIRRDVKIDMIDEMFAEMLKENND